MHPPTLVQSESYRIIAIFAYRWQTIRCRPMRSMRSMHNRPGFDAMRSRWMVRGDDVGNSPLDRDHHHRSDIHQEIVTVEPQTSTAGNVHDLVFLAVRPFDLVNVPEQPGAARHFICSLLIHLICSFVFLFERLHHKMDVPSIFLQQQNSFLNLTQHWKLRNGSPKHQENDRRQDRLDLLFTNAFLVLS